MTFQIKALPEESFAALFSLDHRELRQRQARREIVRSSSGTLCRASLEDAAVGVKVILLNYEYLNEDKSFRASHAIHVHKDARHAHPAVDEIPELFKTRLISVCGFDASHMMVDADAVDGPELEDAIRAMTASPFV